MGVRDEYGCVRARLSLLLLSLLLSGSALAQSADTSVFSRIRPQWQPLAQFLSRADSLHLPVDGNRLELFAWGRDLFPALIGDIDRAEGAVCIEFYRFMSDTLGHEMRDVLCRKARQGVDVRLLLETRTNFPSPSSFYKEMTGEGVRFLPFQKGGVSWDALLNVAIRNHRKTTVIDDRIAYIGGMNVQDRYRNLWRDTHLRLQGPAARVQRRIFDRSWLSHGGSLIPAATDSAAVPPAGQTIVQFFEDGPDTEEETIRLALEMILDAAERYVFIETPYFMPPGTVRRALRSAAARGVDVRIVFPEHSDVFLFLSANQSFYRELLDAGIRIYTRHDPFSHSKLLVSDGYLSCLGSANLDTYSMRINYEENIYVYDEAFSRSCTELISRDIDDSEELDAGTLRFSHKQRLLQGFARFLEPVL